METMLTGVKYWICLVYVDDIDVFGHTFEDTLHNLEQLFKKLEEAGIKFNKDVLFQGYIVPGKCIQTDTHNISCIDTYPFH
jgi:hypothetical protein